MEAHYQCARCKALFDQDKKEATEETLKIEAPGHDYGELISRKHAPKLRYQSTDKKIATVSKTGKIKARSKGRCKIYVYAASGIHKVVSVTVK